MALSQYISYTTTGTKASLNIDASIAPMSATIGVAVGGGATYKIQYSLDALDVADADADWFDDPTLGSGTITSGTTAYPHPVTKIRIVIAAVTDTVKLKVLQGFTIN